MDGWKNRIHTKVISQCNINEEVQELQNRLRMFTFMLDDCKEGLEEKGRKDKPDINFWKLRYIILGSWIGILTLSFYVGCGLLSSLLMLAMITMAVIIIFI